MATKISFNVNFYYYCYLSSAWTKFGLFVPTDVPNAQSPFHFLLMSMYQGPETRQLIEKANAGFFSFINSIIESGQISVDLETATIPVKVLFVGDLKMVPLVFGVHSFSANLFCPICLVHRKSHKICACFGELRNPSTDEQPNYPLLKIPVNNIVCPPLHLLQGLTNKILFQMGSEE